MARLGQEGAHQADCLLGTEIMRLKKYLEVQCREALSSEVRGKLFADDGRRARRDLAQGVEHELMSLVLEGVLGEKLDAFRPDALLSGALTHRAKYIALGFQDAFGSVKNFHLG